jgi:hypothetical protein
MAGRTPIPGPRAAKAMRPLSCGYRHSTHLGPASTGEDSTKEIAIHRRCTFSNRTQPLRKPRPSIRRLPMSYNLAVYRRRREAVIGDRVPWAVAAAQRSVKDEVHLGVTREIRGGPLGVPWNCQCAAVPPASTRPRTQSILSEDVFRPRTSGRTDLPNGLGKTYMRFHNGKSNAGLRFFDSVVSFSSDLCIRIRLFAGPNRFDWGARYHR